MAIKAKVNQPIRGAQIAARVVTPSRRDRLPSQIAEIAHAIAPHSASGTIHPIQTGLWPALGIHA